MSLYGRCSKLWCTLPVLKDGLCGPHLRERDSIEVLRENFDIIGDGKAVLDVAKAKKNGYFDGLKGEKDE